jgi:F-type H+-transporting ATPase subunit b
MSIDWFQIVAQIINFFLILFILQKLLYKPVLKAMGDRQERIEKSQIEADAKMKDANKLIGNYEKKIEEIEEEKRDILYDARKQAQEIKDNLLVDYMKEAEDKRKAYLKEIEDEKESFTKALRKNLGNGGVKIAAYILDAISSKELEAEIFNAFVLNLKDLKRNIDDLDVSKEEIVEIHSFRDLSGDEKKTIENILKDQLNALNEINYATDPSLILGFELNLETYTIHTNIKNYLSEIEKDILKNLDIN